MKTLNFRYFCIALIIFPCICNSTYATPNTQFSPQTVGISEQQWNSYTPQEKTNILQGYNKLLSDPIAAKYFQPNKSKNLCLKVAISQGKALMSTFVESYPFADVSLHIAEDSCQIVRIQSPENNLTTNTIICYIKKVLYLDPSFYDSEHKYGSVAVPFSPLWREGITYKNITTTGYAKLQNIALRVVEENCNPKS